MTVKAGGGTFGAWVVFSSSYFQEGRGERPTSNRVKFNKCFCSMTYYCRLVVTWQVAGQKGGMVAWWV